MPRIFREARELGLPELEIVEIGTRVRVVVHLTEQIRVGETTSQGDSPTQSPESSSGQESPLHIFLRALENKDMSTSELMEYMGLKHRASFRKNYLHPCLEKGYIKQTLPDKPNSRLQKYRLTPKGHQVLNSENDSSIT